VASPSWAEWFPRVRVKHLISACYDHCPIFLDLEQEHNMQLRMRLPRYEVMWEREESLPQEIKHSWEQGATIQNLGDVACKFTKVMMSLKKNWSMEKFRAVTKEIGELEAKIEDLCEQDYTSNKEVIGSYTSLLEELLHREELMWMQRSRVAWLKVGGGGSKYQILSYEGSGTRQEKQEKETESR
jgi:hypothetical protein